MPGVGIEAVLKDFYSQNREIKAEDYLVPENKGEYLDMAFANVTSFLYVRSEPTKESEYVGKLYPGYARRSQVLVGEWTAVESGDVTGYVKKNRIYTDRSRGADVCGESGNGSASRKEKKKQKHLPMQCPENLKKRR